MTRLPAVRCFGLVHAADLECDDLGRVVTNDNVVVESQGQALTIVGHRLPDLVRSAARGER